jgi:hypothetical protein
MLRRVNLEAKSLLRDSMNNNCINLLHQRNQENVTLIANFFIQNHKIHPQETFPIQAHERRRASNP